jgi:hypothetical protein
MAARLRRFLFLERRRPAEAAALPTVGAAERFRAERARELSSGLELAEPSDAQPFTRCGLCGMDNTRYAVRCVNCARSLDTDEQREFNRRLWAEREQTAATPLPEREQRVLGEQIARAVEDDELARRAEEEPRSTGARLLQLIPGARARAATVAALFAAPVGWSLMHRSPAALLVLLPLLALFAPPRPR